MIAARHSMIGWKPPFDAEVEYLETSAGSGSYAFLPLNATSKYVSMEIDAQFLDIPQTLLGNVHGFGVTNRDARFLAGIDCTTRNFPYGIGTVGRTKSITRSGFDRHTFYADSNTGKVGLDGNLVDVTGGTGRVTINNFGVFCCCWPNGTLNYVCSLSVRLFSIKLKVENNLKFDVVPVRVGTTGFLYNKLTRKLYGKEDGADFIVGQDKQL